MLTYDEFIDPLLRYLATQPEPVRTATACKAVAAAVGLPEAERAILLPSRNQAVYRNRIGWAHDRLKRAGYSSSPKRGLWALTPAGRKYATDHPTLSDEQIEHLARVDPESRLRRVAGDEEIPSLGAATSPDERIEEALGEIRERVSRELLEAIRENSPEFFERLVLQLLFKMGYGQSQDALEHVGRAGDGGIDGIIALDKLGLQRVFVQAKRWLSPVGSTTVQTFMGSLQLHGAGRGVLITPGAFTRDAREMAQRTNGALVLIDGIRLAELMLEHHVGVTAKAIEVPDLDSDFFEEE